MSLFNTKIAVDLKPVLDSIPKGSAIHSVGWDADNSQVIVLWESERFHSGLTVPVEFAPNDLKRRVLPQGVRDMRKKQPEPTPAPAAEAPAPAIEPPKVDYVRSETEFNDLILSGCPVEFQGIDPVWKDLSPGAPFVPGFFYRKKARNLVDMETKKE